MSQNNKENKASSNTQQHQPYYPANPYQYYYPAYAAQNPAGYQQTSRQQTAPPQMTGGSQQNYPYWMGMGMGMPGMQTGGQTGAQGGMLPVEESYIENILRLNRGKEATVYMTFENNNQWNAKIFKGIIEAAGRDHIILSDPQSGKRYLLLMVYLDYITFDEEIEYNYPFNNTGGQLVNYPPR